MSLLVLVVQSGEEGRVKGKGEGGREEREGGGRERGNFYYTTVSLQIHLLVCTVEVH